MILAVCAVGKELGEFAARPGVELLVTGVGPVEAAVQLSRALAANRYTAVVNAGIAGVLPGVAQIGDAVVVAEDSMHVDIETGAKISLPDGPAIVERAASDARAVAALVKRGYRSVSGCTVSRVTATDRTALRMRAEGAEIETMEGFAVLRAAQIAGVRCVQVRGISNFVGERSAARWNFAAGATAATRILLDTLSILETDA